jgi:hypothetical protein
LLTLTPELIFSMRLDAVDAGSMRASSRLQEG